jgi:hypothetical protein
LLIPVSKSITLRAALLFCWLCGLNYIVAAEYRNHPFLPPATTHVAAADSDAAVKELLPVVPITGDLQYASKVELIDVHPVSGKPPYNGIFRWCHRDESKMRARITNLSETTWPATRPGANAVSVGIQVMINGKHRNESRMPVKHAVGPGESLEIEAVIPNSPAKSPSNFVRVSMVHDNHQWFCHDDDTQKLDIPN